MDNRHLKERIHYLAPIPTGYAPGGQLVPPIRAIIFDIYGTLFISHSGDVGTAEAMARKTARIGDLCRRYGVEEPPEQLTQRLFQVIRAAHEKMRSSGIPCPEIEIDLIWKKVLGWKDNRRVRNFALEYEWTVNPCYPMPGLDETLRMLRRRGVAMGLISNAQFFTPLLFRLFLGSTPEHIGFTTDLTIYSYQHGQAKPSDTLFEPCHERLMDRGLSPESIVYVGNDMRNDIMPAAKIGWQTVLFAGDQRSLRLREDCDDCRGTQPGLVITDLRALLDWI